MKQQTKLKDVSTVGVLTFTDQADPRSPFKVNVYLGSQLYENHLKFGIVPDSVVTMLAPEQVQTTTDKFRVFNCTNVVQDDDDIIYAEYQRQEVVAVIQL